MTTRTLARTPALPALYAKAVLGSLPRGRRRSDRNPNRMSDADQLAVRLADAEIRPGRLAEYRRICGFGAGRAVPATYPHVLAFPLQLAVMTDPAFPFPALGLVHIGNRIEQIRPLRVGERLELTVETEGAQPHPRGAQITLVSRVDVDGRVVWRDETVLLSRRRTHHPTAAEPGDGPEIEVPSVAPAAAVDWRLPADLGRRYAAVSGDRNPIHLYDVTAKAFGFTQHIAHGMWTKARALAELESRLPGSFVVQVSFKKPIVLPGTVGFGAREHDSVIDFAVTSRCGELSHLLGRIVTSDSDAG